MIKARGHQQLQTIHWEVPFCMVKVHDGVGNEQSETSSGLQVIQVTSTAPATSSTTTTTSGSTTSTLTPTPSGWPGTYMVQSSCGSTCCCLTGQISVSQSGTVVNVQGPLTSQCGTASSLLRSPLRSHRVQQQVLHSVCWVSPLLRLCLDR